MEYRARDDRMPNVELDDLCNGRHRLHIVIVQAVAGMHPETEPGRMSRRLLQSVQLLGALPRAGGFRIGAGMQLHDRRTSADGASLNLVHCDISGTRQQSSGRTRSAIASISAVTAISRFMRVWITARMACRS